MNKIPTIKEILSFNQLDNTIREYKSCQISGGGDLQRIFVDFQDPDLFLAPLWNKDFKVSPHTTDLRLVLWRDNLSEGICKAIAIARYRSFVLKNIPDTSLKSLNQEQFFGFLQNYPDLMEWYLFNPLKI